MATDKQISNDFEETAPPSTSEPKKLPYDVFINHRGPDTKQTVASSIYNSLQSKGLRVFLDEKELQLGDSVTAEMEEAMRTSFLHIAILSPTYARSPWCLDELSFMLRTERTIIPVFYNVEPSDVRYAKGVFADAFAEYERKKRYTPEKLEEWKSALQRVSLLNGQIRKGNEDDGRLLKSIVNCVMKHMKKELQFVVAKHPVGLEEAANDFESILDSSEKIQIVGIVGMEGSGKTTLAKEIYNRKSSSIKKFSFLSAIRDAASKKELYKKQKKLMQDIGDGTIQFDNVEEGKVFLKRCSRFLKVLIILDDVDNLEQLNALLPGIDNFRQGSLIIVTSRELGVLKSWGISSIYQMKGLHLDHARELLCWHAFLNPSPPDEFQDFVEKFVQICNGLPLSLEIFGRLLYQKSKKYWKAQLNKASRLLPSDIKRKLKISFDSLDEEEKEVFLDIACFFIGEEKSLAVAVWDGSGWSGSHSFEVLENKCLVDVDKYNKIKMHDQLRDLGREIAKGWSPLRVWSSQQITDIQKQKTEGVLIRGIKAATDDFFEECSSHHGTPYEECMELLRGFSTKFKGLTPSILVVKGDYFTEELATLFPALLWLRWSNMPRTALPSWLILKSLRVLELPHSYCLEELWNDSADPPLELRALNLADAQHFLSFPEEFCQLESLEYLQLDCCGELTSLPSNFGNLTNLRHLDLISCWKLTSLPGNLGNLSNLRHLQLTYCSELRVLPDSFKQLRNLQHISFSGCKELTLTSENEYILENVTKLETLDLSGCENLQKLPQHIINQLSLRHLDVRNTGLRELPINIGELSKLDELSIGSKFLTSLPSSIGNLSSLRSLNITGCRMLGTLPDSIGNLFSLRSLKIRGGDSLSSLSNLLIAGCDELTAIPESVSHLSSENVLVSSCEPVRSLNQLKESRSLYKKQMPSLASLYIQSCPITELALLSGSFCNLKQINLSSTLLSRISISQQCCPTLEFVELDSNEQLVEIESLPISVKTIKLSKCNMLKGINVLSGMVSLERLSIEYCGGKLDELPSFANLLLLKEFEFIDTADQPMKIQGLENCRSLEKVTAVTCWNVPAIQNLEHMEELQRLFLSAACNISALEPCLQTIRKWPSECIIICARAEHGVESVMNSFAFSGLTLVDSCAEKITEEVGIGELSLKGGQRRCSNQSAMVCFNINSTSTSAHIDFNFFHHLFVGEGKWVCLGVFTEPSLMREEYRLTITEDNRQSRCVELGRGKLVIGEQEKVVEAFKHIILTLGSVNRLKRKAHLMLNKKFLVFLRNVKRLKRRRHLMTN